MNFFKKQLLKIYHIILLLRIRHGADSYFFEFAPNTELFPRLHLNP